MELEKLVDSLYDIRILNYVNVASLTILVYNYVSTFDQELEVIWKSRWTITKVFFVFTRYIPFVDMGLVMYNLASQTLLGHACFTVYQGTIWLFLLGLMIAEGILTLRTWAIWGRTHPRLNLVLPMIFAIFGISEFSMMMVFARSLTGRTGSCLATGRNRAIVISWIILMVYDALMLGIMVTQGFRTVTLNGNSGNSRLLKIVKRDGIIYYCYIFTLSLLNIVVVSTQPDNFLFLFAPLECVIHSVLTAQIIFHIRAEAGDLNEQPTLPGKRFSF
ncbi:hypothetical protein BD779DRAFT_1671349 [Infundibulicybe gibba]|nr:hypothetical protein BD779DRAFT_1671349 [Infundibulicybe gibba]